MNELNQRENDPRRYCRNCNHAEFKHTIEGIHRCGYVPTYLDNLAEFCPCSEFVPKDNLEFLEYKTKQKEVERLSI